LGDGRLVARDAIGVIDRAVAVAAGAERMRSVCGGLRGVSGIADGDPVDDDGACGGGDGECGGQSEAEGGLVIGYQKCRVISEQ
jgi:hypothetical protein